MRDRNGRLYPAIVAAVMVSLLAPHLALAAFGVKLSGTMPAFGDVQDFKISPDGQYAVYVADQQTNGVWEIYSVPLAGGTPVRLNGALPTGGYVDKYQVSPDSSRVVYYADQQTDEVYEIYSVPLAGPAVSGVKLNGALAAGGDVDDDFQVSPVSSWVVYQADQDTNDVMELYLAWEPTLYLPIVLR